jgi:hypothetical protein
MVLGLINAQHQLHADVLTSARGVRRSRRGHDDAASLGGGWLPLDVGRSARLATSGQLKALRVRDGGCIHPGCNHTSAYCDAHHVKHVNARGRTVGLGLGV